MMDSLTATERAVLGLTARQAEDLEQIYLQLHAPPCSLSLAETADAVKSLVERGLLVPRPPGESDFPEALWKSRFEATSQASQVLEADRPGAPPGWPEGRIYPGMFKGLIPDLSFEVFKENRREMWGKLDEDTDDE